LNAKDRLVTNGSAGNGGGERGPNGVMRVVTVSK
jgi:hypothetical protein